jgi:DNA topoisomerase IA
MQNAWPQGKHIVPTEAGLSLFGVLKQADPALVDPGVTAQLECLLDDVVVGKQEMVGARLTQYAMSPSASSASSRKAAPPADHPCWAPRSATATGRFRRRLR